MPMLELSLYFLQASKTDFQKTLQNARISFTALNIKFNP